MANGPPSENSPPGSHLWLRHWLLGGGIFRLAPGRHFPMSGPCMGVRRGDKMGICHHLEIETKNQKFLENLTSAPQLT